MTSAPNGIRSGRRLTRGTMALIFGLIGATACDPAIPPLPVAPTGVTRTVSVTMWVHGAAIDRGRGRRIVALLEAGQGWAMQPPVTLDHEGQAQLTVLEGFRLRLTTRDPFRPQAHQPCVVEVGTSGHSAVEIHVVEDATQLGASLPASLARATPTLSGVVFERTRAGQVPVPHATVDLSVSDASDPFTSSTVASTQTDAEGRYVLCSVPESPGFLTVHKEQYRDPLPGSISGAGQLDIELIPR